MKIIIANNFFFRVKNENGEKINNPEKIYAIESREKIAFEKSSQKMFVLTFLF